MNQRKIVLVILTIYLSLGVMLPIASSQTLVSITWHDSIKKDTIVAWRITSINSTDEHDLSFLRGLIFQMKYIADPPTDPTRVFNATEAPDWVNMYINGFKLNMSWMGGAVAFTQLVLPITYTFDNGSSYNISEYYRVLSPFNDTESYFNVQGNYLNSTFGNETTKLTMFTNINTGIAANVSMLMGDGGYFFLEFYANAANVNENGETTQISQGYTKFHDDPSVYFRNYILTIIGTIALAVIAVIVIILVWRRRKS